jgi:hypothetical protein
MNDYLENIREIERPHSTDRAPQGTQIVTGAAPLGVPDSFDEHVNLMFDLPAAAWHADVTRVFSS